MARNGSIKGTNKKREAEGGCSKTQPYCRYGKMSELLNTRKLNQRMETGSQETETSTSQAQQQAQVQLKRFQCFESGAWGKTYVTLAIAQGFNTTYEKGANETIVVITTATQLIPR